MYVHVRTASNLGKAYVQAFMQFEWDDAKNRTNQAKHRVSFELATLVFDDPHALTLPNYCEDECRWLTTGMVKTVLILTVVHTWEDRSDEEKIRIISARKATPRERQAYDDQYRKP